jgi:predicted nucleic acid-binding protein
VVDASVFVEYLAPGAAHDDVAPLFDPHSATELWAPDLCLAEVANALRKWFLMEESFTRRHLAEAVRDLLDLGVVVVSSRVLVERAIELAQRLTVYDAAYVALAAARRIPLCTLDTGLTAEARKAGVTVLVPGTDAFPA